MAIEALFQKSKATGRLPNETEINQATYKLRNVAFSRTLPLDDPDRDQKIILSLTPCSSTKDSWHEFKISSIGKDLIEDHCQGLICLVENTTEGMFCSTSHPNWVQANIPQLGQQTTSSRFNIALQRQFGIKLCRRLAIALGIVFKSN
jgi:hypothetical protein